jgi:hypothetical protein
MLIVVFPLRECIEEGDDRCSCFQTERILNSGSISDVAIVDNRRDEVIPVQAAKVDSMTKRTIHHEDMQAVYGRVQRQGCAGSDQGPADGCGVDDQAPMAPTQIAPGSARRSRSWPRCSTTKELRFSQPGCGGDEASHQDRPACCGAEFFGQSLRSLSLDRRTAMIKPDHPRLSIVPRCELASSAACPFT